MWLRSSLMLAIGAVALAGFGCGSDDSDEGSPARAPTDPSTAPPGSDAAVAREAAVAYFLSTDPAVCTKDATKRHIRLDYGGKLRRCEAVRRSNMLTENHFQVDGEAEVTGSEAELSGRVLVTGETFVIELRKVDGSWKIDRIRGSQ